MSGPDREARLAAALRANLRRRKTAPSPSAEALPSPPPAGPRPLGDGGEER